MELNDYAIKLSETLQKINKRYIDVLISMIHQAYLKGEKIFIIGNGGSAANASHLAEDLAQQIKGKKSFKETKGIFEEEKRIKAISLTDNTPYITAIGNDYGYENIFVEQLKNIAEPNDILIAISGSGNSPNIIKAVEWAKKNGVAVFGITGFDGGKLKEMLEHRDIHVPINDMYITESAHLVVFHYIIDRLKQLIK